MYVNPLPKILYKVAHWQEVLAEAWRNKRQEETRWRMLWWSLTRVTQVMIYSIGPLKTTKIPLRAPKFLSLQHSHKIHLLLLLYFLHQSALLKSSIHFHLVSRFYRLISLQIFESWLFICVFLYVCLQMQNS